MLAFGRETNVVATLALINPDISCKREIEAAFRVRVSPEELDL